MPTGRVEGQRVHLLVPSRVRTGALQEALKAGGFEPVVTSGRVRNHRRKMPYFSSRAIAIGSEASDGLMLVSRSTNPDRRLALVAPFVPNVHFEEPLSLRDRPSNVDIWKAQIRRGMRVIFVAGGQGYSGIDLFGDIFRPVVTSREYSVSQINQQLKREDTIKTIVNFMSEGRT